MVSKKFRKGYINDEVIRQDPLEGIVINPSKASRGVLYYVGYNDDTYAMKKSDNGEIAIGIIEQG